MTTAPAGSVAPVNTVAPAISGTVQQGQTLTTTTGSWSPAPSSYGYQWQRSTDGGSTWSAIVNATDQTYTVAAGDLNDDLRVVVTANDAWGSTTLASALVGPVASGAPVNTVYPTISGTAQQGQALTAAPGTWSPSAGTYSYQWQSSTDGGSTWTTSPARRAPTYSVVGGDLGADVRVIVTGQNAFGSSNATAAMVGPVSSGHAGQHDAALGVRHPQPGPGAERHLDVESGRRTTPTSGSSRRTAAPPGRTSAAPPAPPTRWAQATSAIASG